MTPSTQPSSSLPIRARTVPAARLACYWDCDGYRNLQHLTYSKPAMRRVFLGAGQSGFSMPLSLSFHPPNVRKPAEFHVVSAAFRNLRRVRAFAVLKG